jgi:predicted aspartyl protease
MGMVHAEITLKNVYDEMKASEGLIKLEDVRSVTVTAVADTGSLHLVINEELREKLGLTVVGDKTVLNANGQQVPCKIAETVKVNWKNRCAFCSALVVPGAKAVLFGAIPLEDMDLIVNPVTQEIVGAHGDEILIYCF